MSSEELLLAVTTLPDRESAERLGRVLVEERLIACANVVPGLSSVFRWQGTVQTEAEVLVLMKTRRTRMAELEQRLPELHPYEVPELIALPVPQVLDAYRRWVMEETMGAET